jgi:hypothetical protein
MRSKNDQIQSFASAGTPINAKRLIAFMKAKPMPVQSAHSSEAIHPQA